MKTEKGLVGHEKRCGPNKELEPEPGLAAETKQLFEITDEEKQLADQSGETEDEVVKNELKKELSRLKSEFLRQKEEERRLQKERTDFLKERDEFYTDMTKGKGKASKAVLDPFGDDLQASEEVPSLSGPPIHKKPEIEEPSLKAETETPSEIPDAPSAADVDISSKTEALKKKFKLSEGKLEPDRPELPETDAPSQKEISLTEEIRPISEDKIFDSVKERFEAEIENRFGRIEDLLDDLQTQYVDRAELEALVSEKLSKEALDDYLEQIIKDIEKIDSKVNEMGEEIGFGESLDVSKIPPSILESVYEATLTDAITALIHSVGPYDSETIIRKILEDIRTQTSGSELFKFEEGKLRILNLARSLENKQISARQIQSTYSELLKKILDYAPGYKPKNFRAMLKIKSQEFAVDKTSGIDEILDEIRQEFDEIRHFKDELAVRVSELEESRNELMADVRDIWEKLNDLEVKMGVSMGEILEATEAETGEPGETADSDEKSDENTDSNNSD